MRALGIDIAASELYFVVLESSDGSVRHVAANKLRLAETRDVRSIKAFQSALTSIFTEAAAKIVAIRSKPENGRMRAGAAALKIEALVLAQSLAPVRFYSSQRLKGQEQIGFGLPNYYELAIKAALVALDDAQ